MRRISIWTLWLGVLACAEPSEPVVECEEDIHCKTGRCVNNQCIGGGEPTCEVDCGVGESCVGGVCRAAAACRSHPDCGDNNYCLEGQCFPKECDSGEERACDSECGEGVQRCRLIDDLPFGVFGPCNAPQPQLYEICGDHVDNNCDGEVDEECGGCVDGLEQPCISECGEGLERCLGSEWRGCTAPRPRREVCGNGIDEDCNGMIDDGCDDCEEGATRECETECGLGQEICRENTWRDCDAQIPTEEICDNVDNDCDGAIDEEILRDCSTQCGPGVQHCAAGVWIDCTAPEDCACGADGVDVQVCGHCGRRQRDCVTEVWGEWGECQEAAACIPGASEEIPCGNCGTMRRICTPDCTWGDWQDCKSEGICEAGATENEACPMGCGEKTRRCSDTCVWEAWSECGVGGVGCMPGETETESCGETCGVKERVCGDDCAWGEWGECVSQGECVPGETGGEPCDEACSARERVCSDECTWGEWGACQGGGVCAPGESETRDCERCGIQHRDCTDACVYGEWSACEAMGECEPGERNEEPCGPDPVGLCQPGVHLNTCDEFCFWEFDDTCHDAVYPSDEICGNEDDEDCDGVAQVRPDAFESNNTCDTCYMLNDGLVDPANLLIEATMDSYLDRKDYYCFEGEDSSFGIGEDIDITLTDIPNGRDYDIFLYRGVQSCRDGEPLVSSRNSNNDDEVIHYEETFNSDDTDRYIVEVRRFGSNENSYHCEYRYSLTVDGLR